MRQLAPQVELVALYVGFSQPAEFPQLLQQSLPL
jgi:hypothetical protein